MQALEFRDRAAELLARIGIVERMARDVRMFTIGGGTAQVLRTLVAGKMLGWKLPQTRGGYAGRSPSLAAE